MNQKQRGKWWLIGIFIALVLIDQATKLFFSQRDGVIFNSGGVFGIFPGLPWTGFLIVLLFWLILLIFKSQSGVEQWGLVMIVAGGASNIIDRLLIGSVRDFIYWPIINVWGNLADLSLVIGIVILLFPSLKSPKHT